MKDLELYIEDDNGNKDRVDLFDFEAINLNQKIKDVRDIGKIFTDYSQSFKVPASPNNNRIFKHYYNYSIADGYDARFKAKGSIKMAGADFRFGKIRLDDVDVKYNQPYAYKIVFFGSSVALAEILGDDELGNLDYLNRFNHDYNEGVVRTGLITGLKYDATTDAITGGSEGDIIYPFISCNSYYYYDSDPSDHGHPDHEPTPSNNLHKHGTTAHNGINFRDLKPSIKARHIINAIEDKYEGLFFDKTWLDTAPFNELYMHLHRDKGAIESAVGDTESIFTQQDFGVNLDIGSIITDRYKSYTLTFSISPQSGTGPYNLRVVDTRSGDTLGYANGLDSDGSLVLDYDVLSSEEPRNWNLNFYVTTSEGSTLNSFNASLGMTERTAVTFQNTDIIISYDFEDYSFTSPNSPEFTASYIVVTSQIPKMKVIDFLQSIFKMFNLTAFFQRDESLPSKSRIMIQPLNSYYTNGKVIDVSKYVDISETTVSRPPTYSEISFTYSKPKTFGIKNQNELLNDEFGDLTRDNRDLANFVSDGGKYQVKVGFEHLLYERTTDPSNVNYATPFQYGWLVDSNENTVKTNPILHFAVSTTVNTSTYTTAFTGAVTVSNPLINKYFRPSNSSSDGSQTLNFNSEYDEFTGIENSNSLFKNFYQTYIGKAFSKSARLVTMNATLPLSVLLSYELSDVFRINGLDYNINSLQTNLLTGKSKLELISGSFAEATRPDTPHTLSVTNRGTDNMNISWTVPATGVRAVHYTTYIDGVAHGFGDITYTGSTPNNPVALLRNLTAGQTYSIQVTSLSVDLVESYRSEVLLASTSTGNSTPTDPTNLAVDSRTDNSILLEWDASTFDNNLGETGYNIYGRVGTTIDFLLFSSVSTDDFATANSTHNITGLSAGTNYQFKVSAYDSFATTPNSGFSNTVTTQTTDVTDLVPPSVPTNFTSSNVTTTSVDLSWFPSFNPDGTAADGYKVYQGTTQIATTTNTTYSVTGLTSATTYKFFVSSYDANGNESNTAGPVIITTL